MFFVIVHGLIEIELRIFQMNYLLKKKIINHIEILSNEI
jgi:hypothetical protein